MHEKLFSVFSTITPRCPEASIVYGRSNSRPKYLFDVFPIPWNLEAA